MSSLEKHIIRHALKRVRTTRALASATVPEGSRSAVRLREVEFGDCTRVSELKSLHKLKPDLPANWQRFWKDNPAIIRSSPRPLGWVLEQDKDIVGYIGNIALRCFYRGTPLNVATTHALVVQPSVRAYTGALVSAFVR